MSNQVHSFLNGLTSYYQIGQHPASSSYCNSHSHCAPAYGIPFGYGGSSSGRNVTVVADGRDLGTLRRHDREDREEQRQTNAAVVGGIATVVLAGASAFFLKGYKRDCEELRKAEEFRADVIPTLDRRMAIQIAPIAKKHIEILEAKCAASRNIAILSGALLASAAAAFAGGMFAVSWLITASIVSSVSFGAIGVFLIVWHWTDEASLPIDMQQKVQQLRQQTEPWFSWS